MQQSETPLLLEAGAFQDETGVPRAWPGDVGRESAYEKLEKISNEPLSP